MHGIFSEQRDLALMNIDASFSSWLWLGLGIELYTLDVMENQLNASLYNLLLHPIAMPVNNKF